VESSRTSHAKRLFAGIAPEYERVGAALSFGQDPRWRRFLVSRVNAIPGSWALDVASGTGLVARELARRNLRVVGLDQSEAMVHRGVTGVRGAGLADRIAFVLGQAERLPFPDETFDAVTFTYLLRYVDDPQATLTELARVLRPGGVMAALEFHVPPEPWVHAGWMLYTRAVMPAVGWVVSPGWHRAMKFLGPSVTRFYERYPLPVQVRMWQEAGMRRVRTRVMSLGGGIVVSATKRNPVTDE
jgi:demethylmenaquinone methyltransferase/2-methoxy-6-polyprenyl-1,4-benzoquinol methylase